MSHDTIQGLRQAFLDYFARQNHQLVSSSPLVPHNDPSLLFTNAGMVQFKDVFTGLEERPYKRAASSQKCVRAGGKHNDLDNVGYTARHHTFFEMLGNFSFGDYFKEQAISFAWEFVNGVLALPKDKLLVTVYHTDDEAAAWWKKIAGLPEERIIRISTNDNFWSMGETGPCGPCTEIFFDHGAAIPGGPPGSPEQDGDRFIEIWNLVFMQFEQQAGGKRVALPRPSIDTGAGLERVAAVLQGVHNNYEIDLFRNLISASESLTGTKAAGAQLASHRVIADHLRSASFLISDGVLPSNEGRGYVLRRILRRAMRHVHLLGSKEPLLHRLFPSLQQEMGQAYPELMRAGELVRETLRQEEERFGDILARGLKLLEAESAPLGAGGVLAGEVAFKLYDTYGFPLDLTQDILRARAITVHEESFAACMEEQRTMARKAWVGSGDAAIAPLWFTLRDELGESKFTGYETESTTSKIVAIVNAQKERLSSAEAGTQDLWVLTAATPFYAESGGQEGDYGLLGSEVVKDTQKFLGLHAHYIERLTAPLKVGAEVVLQVDRQRRLQLRANHSATHILHAVLRRHFGEHVTQKGSLVTAERLRFDITLPKGLNAAELGVIEQEVNRVIRQNQPVATQVLSSAEAIEQGAMALFGEKYGDQVRVIAMGDGVEAKYSYELCGGTHVQRTGDIGLFKIISEGAVAAGVRRIEALTGAAALSYLSDCESALFKVANLLKVPARDVEERVQGLLEEHKKLNKALEAEQHKALQALVPGEEQFGHISLHYLFVDNLAAKQLRPLAQELAGKAKPETVVVVASGADGKLGFVVSVGPALSKQLDAATLAKQMATAAGGSGGGGSPTLAQAGAPDASKAPQMLAALREQLAQVMA